LKWKLSCCASNQSKAIFGWIQEDAKMNHADADAAKADLEPCEEEAPSG